MVLYLPVRIYLYAESILPTHILPNLLQLRDIPAAAQIRGPSHRTLVYGATPCRSLYHKLLYVSRALEKMQLPGFLNPATSLSVSHTSF